MYAIKSFLKALLFTAGLLSAGWFFMPWKQVGEVVLFSAAGRLPKPVSLAYSTVESVRDGFVVNNLEVKNLMGMTDIFFNTVTIVPDAAASLMDMAPTCMVSFTGAVIGDIAVTPLKKMPGVSPGNGRLVASINRQGIFLDGLRSDGELSMNGSILVNPSEMKIIWADMAMDVKSEAFEENLSIVGSALNLPLHQEGRGRWLLRRPRSP